MANFSASMRAILPPMETTEAILLPVIVPPTVPVDFVMFGRTGTGKSTTGNNLIGAQEKRENGDIKALKATEKIQETYCSSEERYFKTSDGFLSCTKECQVLSHGPIRVLDVPGFADSSDSEDGSNTSVCERNLALFRRLMCVQEEFELRFHRVLFFLPQRGPLRKIDGHLKEELDMFYTFFGNYIFDSMIIIGTQDIDFQDKEFDLDCTRKAVTLAIEIVWKKHKETYPKPPNCPPLIYLPLGISTQDLLTKIKDAPIPMGTSCGTLTIAPNMCAKCGWSVIKVNNEPFQVTNGEETVSFSDSVCHPRIISKYTLREKVGGGIAHIATFGLALLHENISGKETWPAWLYQLR